MSDLPLLYLALWRAASPAFLRKRPDLTDNLLAFLLEHTVPASDGQRALLGRIALTASTDDMIRLARLIRDSSSESDLAMSWVLCAAIRDSDLARLLLAEALLERAREFGSLTATGSPRRRLTADRKTAVTRMMAGLAIRNALGWSAEIDLGFLRHASIWARAFKDIANDVATPVPSATVGPEPAPSPSEKAELPSTPMLTVVAQIGDPDSDEGQTLARVYQRLTEPLPLRGGATDPDALGEALRLEFPHFAAAIDRIVGDLRLRRYAGEMYAQFRPLLLMGLPGIGKTRLAKRLSALLETGYGEVSGAGSSDDRMLRGTARGWRGGQPSLPLLAMLRSQSANPIILIDEIDKAGGSERAGDIRNTLLPLLESETARAWFDEALLAPCDLSRVSWILTANTLERLSRPLLSRVAIISCERPGPEGFDRLIESILGAIAQTLTIERRLLPELDTRVVEQLREAFSENGDVRRLRRAVEAALGAAAAKPGAITEVELDTAPGIGGRYPTIAMTGACAGSEHPVWQGASP